MIFTDIDKTQPYTVMMVTEPVRLACLSFAGLARGVYYIQGDFRQKIRKVHDMRLVEAGLVALRFISETEKPAEYVEPKSTEKPIEVNVDPASKPEMPVIPRDADMNTPEAQAAFDESQQEEGEDETVEVIPERKVIAEEPAHINSLEPVKPVTQLMDTKSPMKPGDAKDAVIGTDREPVVILDEPKKKRRGRPPKVIAPDAAPSKLGSYDEDLSNTDSGPAASATTQTAQDSSIPENSKALA